MSGRRESRDGLILPLAAALLLLAGVERAQAAEMVVQGDVVRVVALSDIDAVSASSTAGAASGAAGCATPRPPAEAGLAAVLAWDLRLGCAASRSAGAASGYRVTYRWDGRTYSRVMDHDPGDTVSLRVRID